MDSGISTSIFDIFKIGPGPSSSHTIGPMVAAGDFLERAGGLNSDDIKSADRIEVILFGSLASTGRGHGTDKAILAGLMGQRPETCDIKLLISLLDEPGKVYNVSIAGKQIEFRATDIVFDENTENLDFQNTMQLRLFAKEKVLLKKTYYSVGGGFIQIAGETSTKTAIPPYRYKNMNGLLRLTSKYDITLPELLMKNECVISAISREQINAKLLDILNVMEDAVLRGIHAEGVLPGPIGLARKAPAFYRRAMNMADNPDRFMALLNAFSMAVAEENAAGHLVITAPTSGSSGVLPGIIYYLRHYQKVPDNLLFEGLMIAGAIAFIAKHNASISGAEVGCQGEIGVAASMAAVLLSHVNGNPAAIESAAEIALEHHLGMTCDPVGGYVQIPCIERNAVGAVTAYNAYLLACIGDPGKQKVSFDEVVDAMRETGRSMSSKFKETAKGGLAVCSLCG